jgi:hypothetical protein
MGLRRTAGVIIGLALMSFPGRAHAAESPVTLSRQTPLGDVELAPGRVGQAAVNLANTTATVQSVHLNVTSVGGPAGSAEWVRLSDQVVNLDANGTHRVAVSVTVPADAVPGTVRYSLSGTTGDGTLLPEVVIPVVVGGKDHANLMVTDVRLVAAPTGESIQVVVANAGSLAAGGTITITPAGLGPLTGVVPSIAAGSSTPVLVAFTGATAGTKYLTAITIDYASGDQATWRGQLTAGDHTHRAESAEPPLAAPVPGAGAGGATDLSSEQTTPPAPANRSASATPPDWLGPVIVLAAVALAVAIVVRSRRRLQDVPTTVPHQFAGLESFVYESPPSSANAPRFVDAPAAPRGGFVPVTSSLATDSESLVRVIVTMAAEIDALRNETLRQGTLLDFYRASATPKAPDTAETTTATPIAHVEPAPPATEPSRPRFVTEPDRPATLAESMPAAPRSVQELLDLVADVGTDEAVKRWSEAGSQ